MIIIVLLHCLVDFEYREYSLITTGTLQGRFMYMTGNWVTDNYSKRCSSVLGRSILLNNNLSYYIADKPDLNVLIDPLGGIEVQKRDASLICHSHSVTVN